MTWDEAADAQLQALWNEGHSTAEIGRRMGLTKHTVVGRARRMNFPSRPSPILAPRVGPDEAQQALMRALVARGYTRPQIARQMGQTLTTIHGWAQGMGMVRARAVGANSAEAVERARAVTEALRAEASARRVQQGGGAAPDAAGHHIPAPPCAVAGTPGSGGTIARAAAGCGGMDVSSRDLPPAVATRPAVFSGVKEGCRWPLWADNARSNQEFCGARRVQGVYCAAHRARAYAGLHYQPGGVRA